MGTREPATPPTVVAPSGMTLPANIAADLRTRLRRIEGQIRGLQGMIDEGRDCRQIVTQVSAALHALEQVGFKIVASGLTYCIEHPDEAAHAGYSVDDVQRMFMRLA